MVAADISFGRALELLQLERPTKDRAYLLLCEAGTLGWLHVYHISVKVFDHDQTESTLSVLASRPLLR